jgi:hypothetical protein
MALRTITERQARACENAHDRRCRCRCGGVLHGAGRIRDDESLTDRLPAEDPHRPHPERPMALFANA